MPAMTQDARNRSTWSRASSRRWLDAMSDADAGERVAIETIRDAVRDKPILDLGVGTGRTIPLFAPLTHEYRGIDYLATMVAECRARYPAARVDLGDARDLIGVPSRHFGLVAFTFNGIDGVPHQDRRRVLAEMRRVMRDDGVALFSTLNLDGPAFRERPWLHGQVTARTPLRRLARTAMAWASTPFDTVRWARLRVRSRRGVGWALAPLSAHHYGVLAHFTTVERQLDELARAGFSRDAIVVESETGSVVSRDRATGAKAARAAAAHAAASWFHFIARAP